MSILRADYFDGKTSAKHPVTLVFAAGRLHVVGADVDAEFDLRRVRRSLPVAGTPRWFYLPGGGACTTSDVAAVDRMTRKRRYERTLLAWEARPLYAGISVALVAVLFWLLVDYGVPAAASVIAERIPVEAEAALGRESLQGLDKYVMRPSRLALGRQKALRDKLAEMTRAAGADIRYRLEFRASPVIGANAFALPSGIVVMTDELVKMSRGDHEVLGVLAHELGHLHYRHTMRRLLEASATALVVAGVTGDLSSASSLAASAPTLLLQTKYSRANEREADLYAIDMMRKAGINPRGLGDILARMEAKAGGRGAPGFLSSHPATQERVALTREGGPPAAAEPAPEPEPLPERPRLAALDPVQREVLALAQAKDFAGLERVLGGALGAFEADAAALAPLLNAYGAFGKLPDAGQATLEAWARQAPSSQAAALALGGFFLEQALGLQDSEAWQQQPKESRAAFETALARSRAELERALSLSRAPYLARHRLMTAARLGGDRAAEQAHYAEAARLAPRRLEPRLEHMRALEPRWGGSEAQMQSFLEESRRELGDAVVAPLAARIPAQRARERSLAGDWAQALRLYEEAIRLDASAAALCGRARALTVLKRPQEALADVERALAKARDERACLREAVRVAEQITDPQAVVRLLTLVIESDPSAVEAYKLRAFAHEYLGKPELARKDYAAAAELGDEWAEQRAAPARPAPN